MGHLNTNHAYEDVHNIARLAIQSENHGNQSI